MCIRDSASPEACAPPRNTSVRTSCGSSVVQLSRFIVSSGRPPHRVHIRERIRRGNSTPFVRIVHDGRDEVAGKGQRTSVTNHIYGCISGCVQTDLQRRFRLGTGKSTATLDSRQDLGQQRLREFTGTAATAG